MPCRSPKALKTPETPLLSRKLLGRRKDRVDEGPTLHEVAWKRVITAPKAIGGDDDEEGEDRSL